MEHTARRFARRVLALHLVALVLIGVLVTFAAVEVYQGAREQALVQARKRQELLAVQTARGIESYYDSIMDNLDLHRRAEEGDSEAQATEPARPDDRTARPDDRP